MPLWQRQSAGESRWAWTEAVGVGRATLRSARQPLVPQMYQLLVQLAIVCVCFDLRNFVNMYVDKGTRVSVEAAAVWKTKQAKTRTDIDPRLTIVVLALGMMAEEARHKLTGV